MSKRKNAEKSICEGSVCDIITKMYNDAVNKNGLTLVEINKYCIAIIDAENSRINARIRRNEIFMAKCRKILGKEAK